MHKIYSILLTLKDIVICHRAGLNWIEHLKLINQKHKKLTVLFLDKSIHISHWFWFIHGVKELFVDKTYFFQSDSKSPLIIDCGANIGMSVLYFKQLHPTSKVICFEPDTHLFELLKKNISTFEYRNIEFINSAVWKKDGFIKFSANGHVGGKITEIDSGISLPASRLKNFLNQPVDFLKMDIEGAEFDVLDDCKDDLNQVENIFIEYHSQHNSDQKLHAILEILSKAGFRYYVKEAWPNRIYPFVEKNKTKSVYDLQLNIFGYRQT